MNAPKDYAPHPTMAGLETAKEQRKQRRDAQINNALLLATGMTLGAIVTGVFMQWYFCVCPGVGQ